MIIDKDDWVKNIMTWVNPLNDKIKLDNDDQTNTTQTAYNKLKHTNEVIW